ncbi:MAG: mechanosensitive ion channel [Lachnospiraceae bacterium]|nr:mechanosensitive ion channel [Lachnospiraceae bacterium]
MMLLVSGMELEDAEEKIDLIQSYLKELPDMAIQFGIRVILALICLVIGFYLIKFIRKMLNRSLARTSTDKGTIQFLDSFVKSACYVLLILLIASGFGLDAATVVAILGSAGVAIGLAIQGSLSNLAGGILILFTKPFLVGDYIVTGGHEGTVTEIKIFYTKLVTVDNRVVVLPNGALANGNLINTTANPYRRVTINVSISYDADIRQTREVLLKLLETEEMVEQEKPKLVVVDELGDNAVFLQVHFWVKKENYLNAKWRLTEDCKYALDEHGIPIPFPQLDVHLRGTKSEKETS